MFAQKLNTCRLVVCNRRVRLGGRSIQIVHTPRRLIFFFLSVSFSPMEKKKKGVNARERRRSDEGQSYGVER